MKNIPSHLGHKHSDEAKKKMTEKKLGKTKYKINVETYLKIKRLFYIDRIQIRYIMEEFNLSRGIVNQIIYNDYRIENLTDYKSKKDYLLQELKKIPENK